jgi:hypothetical protein
MGWPKIARMLVGVVGAAGLTRRCSQRLTRVSSLIAASLVACSNDPADPVDQEGDVGDVEVDGAGSLDAGAPPPGHCCQAIPSSANESCLGRSGPLLERCPTGYQCLGHTEPYCYAQKPGRCEPIPVNCPEPTPGDAVKADCVEHATNYGVTLPADGVFASECEARRAGYIWIMTPVVASESP